MAPATELPDEIIEEIFLRIHPADGTTLTRAALVCRRWCRLIADPGFRRRLHEFHRAPHMLGYSCNAYEDFERRWSYRPPSGVACFVRTSSSLKSVDMERSCVMHGHPSWPRPPLQSSGGPGELLLIRLGPHHQGEACTTMAAATRQVPGNLECSRARLPRQTLHRGLHRHLDCHGKPFTVVYIATSTATANPSRNNLRTATTGDPSQAPTPASPNATGTVATALTTSSPPAAQRDPGSAKLSAFAKAVQRKLRSPLAPRPTKTKRTATPLEEKLPKRSARLANHPLAKVASSKRAEVVLMRRFETTSEDRQSQTGDKQAYQKFYDDDLRSRNFEAVRDLMPALRSVCPALGLQA
ncbi:unnamed protein product [Urochloa humidicola]